jgi:mannose-6-phosphate isomerase
MTKRIGGVTQHYAWGGFHYLPQLLGLANHELRPFAELWFGDHSGGNSPVLNDEDGIKNLRQYIDTEPGSLLGAATHKKYQGRLPFLLKILDVRNMLSIQAHPSKEAATKGFLEENRKQIPLNAPNRVFKDQNPKPEMMVALTPFWLLHGFLPTEAAAKNLALIPSLESFSHVFTSEGIKKAYEKWMSLPQVEVDACLAPLHRHLIQLSDTAIEKSSPDYWAKKAFLEFPSKEGHYDRGIFSIYVMNLVHLQPGEAIFQDTGLLHAYLEGTNIELMVNSDNVFRGGLTDKFMDIPLLLHHLDFRPTHPIVIKPKVKKSGEKEFEVPSKDFYLSSIELKNGADYRLLPAEGPTLLLCLAGSIKGMDASGLSLNAGEAFFIPHQTALSFRCEGIHTAVLYQAGIPKT